MNNFPEEDPTLASIEDKRSSYSVTGSFSNRKHNLVVSAHTLSEKHTGVPKLSIPFSIPKRVIKSSPNYTHFIDRKKSDMSDEDNDLNSFASVFKNYDALSFERQLTRTLNDSLVKAFVPNTENRDLSKWGAKLSLCRDGLYATAATMAIQKLVSTAVPKFTDYTKRKLFTWADFALHGPTTSPAMYNAMCAFLVLDKKWDKFSSASPVTTMGSFQVVQFMKNHNVTSYSPDTGWCTFWIFGAQFLVYAYTGKNSPAFRVICLRQNRKSLEMLLEHLEDLNEQYLAETVSTARHTPDIRVRDVDSSGSVGDEYTTPGRCIDRVAISKKVKTEVIEGVSRWLQDREFYRENDIPYKLNIMLHGPAGTGKTTLGKLIATNTQRCIWRINLNHISDSGLERVFKSAARDSQRGVILLLEDFDDDETLRDRETGGKRVTEIEVGDEKKGTVKKERRTLSTILNGLDGVAELTNVITIATTNTLNDLDAAVYRDGRFDIVVEVTPFDRDETIQYIKQRFPKAVIADTVVFPTMTGATLQKLYIANRNDLDAYIKSIVDYVPNH